MHIEPRHDELPRPGQDIMCQRKTEYLGTGKLFLQLRYRTLSRNGLRNAGHLPGINECAISRQQLFDGHRGGLLPQHTAGGPCQAAEQQGVNEARAHIAPNKST